MATLFRYLVVISSVLFVAYWSLPYVDYNWLTEEELRLIGADGYGSIFPISLFIYWSMFVIWLTLSIGLFFYVRIARTGFLVFIIVSTCASFFWGFRVLAPYEIVIGNIIGFSDGAILAMAYFTSVDSKFSNES